MKEIDDNLKAKFADYLNGRNVVLSPEESDMLAEDDALAAECLEIAEISSEYESTAVKKSVRTYKLNVAVLSLAACLVAALVITVLYDGGEDDTRVSSLNPGREADKGWNELSGGASKTVVTASSSSEGFYTAAPDTPFEVEPARQDAVSENDTVKIFTAENPVPIMTTTVENGKKKVKKIRFKDGLAEGLYEYRVFHDDVQVDQGGIVIGED